MTAKHLITGLTFFMASLPGPWLAADTFSEQRQQMISEIASDVQRTAEAIERDALGDNVMDAMNSVPRHEFVADNLRNRAYENRPLPIGSGQTISQPYIVALMTDLLEPRAGDRILEIGTGSGYQAAVLAEIVDQVYSIEILEALGESSAQLLTRLGYRNIHTRIADGYNGWAEHAPFDGIIVTAAIRHLPPPLIQQLTPGGRMGSPGGSQFRGQRLTLLEKDAQETITTRQLLPVRFVAFTGGH